MKNAVVKREAAPVAVRDGEVDFAEVRVTNLGTPAERIRWHLGEACALGRRALAHAIEAGWELAAQKARLGWGGWGEWCRANLDFSKETADRYIALYDNTVGAARAAIGLALENDVTDQELDAATIGMDDKSVTGAMVALGVIRRSKAWGGDRRKEAAQNGKTVGRPAKGAAAEVAEAAKDPDLNWAEVSGYLKGIREFAVEEDGFGTLADDDLETAVVILTEAAERARTLLAARREGPRGAAPMDAAEASSIIGRGL